MALRSRQSRGIFEQLQEESQPGVHVVIENHDAWVNSAEVQGQIDAATRQRLAHEPRMAAVAQRIREQREKLAALAVVLPKRAKSAGVRAGGQVVVGNW